MLLRRLTLGLALSAAPAAAQLRAPIDSASDTRAFSFYDRGPYRRAVPRPDSILGYHVGDLQTQFLMQERVLLAIAGAARDRVRVEEIGETYERRPMRLYVVSHPDNIARLDQIRADLDRLADPRGMSAADHEALAARVPAVVWINESVHGNEAPGFEAAMPTLYHLAASEEPATVEALRNTIVVLNPSTNPDGHERFAVWYNSIHVRDPEPFTLEHSEPWSIQGRYNHFRFDMNRDVMTTTQLEARALIRGMLRWHPVVAIDQHGQTTNYFFPPTSSPMNANIAANGNFQRWMEIYGKANAAAFDRFGWAYYSRDIFDFFGAFYWDTWPSLTGAIGMTYETDGGGWKGILWRRDDGSLLSNRDGIARHHITALATWETTALNHAQRNRDYAAFRRAAVDEGRSQAMKRVVLVPGRDPGRAAELVQTLLRAGIEVRRATGAFSSTRAHAFADDAAAARRFDAGAFVIDLAQPQGRLARAFLEPNPRMDTAFARAQIEKLRRNQRRGANASREGYEFYDVTAWSLPVTFGVEAYWTEDAPAVGGDLVALPAAPVRLALAGDPTTASERERQQTNARRITAAEPLAPWVTGGITGGRRATSSYVFTAETNGSARLAYHLLADGHRVAVATMPIEAGGRTLPRGTYIVRVSRNDTTVHAAVERLARESGVEVMAVNSAFTEGGAQYGTGSEAVQSLVAPRIALVGDEGTSQTGYGALWWTLERRYGIRFTPVALRWLAGGDLSQFNVIIVPDGSSGQMQRLLGDAGAARVKDWVQRGGTLITMGGATAWAARDNVALTTARPVGADPKADSIAAAAPRGDTATANARRRESQDASPDDVIAATSPSASSSTPAGLPGAHFDVVLDRSHWLTHGYEQPRVTVMLDGGTFFKLSKEGTNVGVFPSTGRLLRAGWAWPDNTERLLRGTAFLIEESMGEGHFIGFANEPMFRAWWRSLDRLVLNGVLLGPAF